MSEPTSATAALPPGGAPSTSLGRPRSMMWVFLSIVLGIDVAVHAYVASRLVFELSLPGAWGGAGLAAVAALALLMLAGPFLQRSPWHGLARAVAWPAYSWMGALWLIFVGLVVSDLALLVARVAGWLPLDDAPSMLAVARWRAVAVLAAAAALGAVGMWSALAPPRVRRVPLRIPGWPAELDGYELVQLSDLHLGSLLGPSFARAVVDRTNALQPDALAITGDLVDGDVEALAPAVAPFGELRARDGVYFVTGNHDYYSGADPWLDEIRRLGIRVLRNERVSLRGTAGFDLAGVDDRQGQMFGGDHGEDLAQALDGRARGRPVILLAHQPLGFREAAGRGVSLMLSGHTHGGQIAPFMLLTKAVYSRYVAGLYRRGDSQLYVHRGTGFWGPPFRLGAPAEITLFEITGMG